MLKVFSSFRELDFSKLMEVYAESNQENGKEYWPGECRGMQVILAEQDFRQYLQEVFFAVSGAVYGVWIESGRYVSALRLEPYRDGMLLEALETAPDSRGKGYAAALVLEMVTLYPGKIYSHIHKRNTPSIKVHTKCGFKKITDHAVYVDGSVSYSSGTYLLEASLMDAIE